MSNSKPSGVNFDEAFYLEENPDVREAVRRGQFRSGFAHYLTHGQREGRAPCPIQNPPNYRFKAAIPPRPLRLRVHGAGDLNGFEVVGKTICEDICAALGSRVTLTDKSRILDFGCGCGRILVYFRDACPGVIDGTDIDREAIEWCEENLSSLATFHENDEWPPLAFEDATFDVIYSVSVFTHIPEDMQTAWLGELRRVVKPGGHVLLTTHGEELLPKVSAADRARFEEGGFLYWSHGRTDGLPDFYQDTFQTERYIRSHWSRFFDIDAVVKRGICKHQDLVVCRRPA